MYVRVVAVLSFLLIGLSAACSTRDDYKRAFDQAAPTGATRAMSASQDHVRQAVIDTLVKSGFTLSQVTGSVVSATRSMQDQRHEEISYRITATASISPAGDGATQLLTLSANQRTLQLSPRGFVVRSESTVEDPEFFGSFFSGVDQGLARLPASPTASAPPPGAAQGNAASTPAPAGPAPALPAAAPAGSVPLESIPSLPGLVPGAPGPAAVPVSAPADSLGAAAGLLGAGVSMAATATSSSASANASVTATTTTEPAEGATDSGVMVQNAAASTLLREGATELRPTLLGREKNEQKSAAQTSKPVTPP